MDAGALPPAAAEAVRLFLRSYPAGEERAEAAQLALRYGILALRQQHQQGIDGGAACFPSLPELRQLVIQSVLPKLDGRLVELQKQLDAYQESLGRDGGNGSEQRRCPDAEGEEAARDSYQTVGGIEAVAQVPDAPENTACMSKEFSEPSTYHYRRRQVASAANLVPKPSAKWRAGDNRRQWTDRQPDPPSTSQLQCDASKLQARIYPKWWFNMAEIRQERRRFRPKAARPQPRLAYSVAVPGQSELVAAYAHQLKPVKRLQDCSLSQRSLDPPVAAQRPAACVASVPIMRSTKRAKSENVRTGIAKRASRHVESVVKADIAARTKYALQRIEAQQRALLDSVRQSSPLAYGALMRDIVQGYSHQVPPERIADAFLSNPWMKNFASPDSGAVVNRFALDQPEVTWEPHEGQDLTPTTSDSRPAKHKDQPNAYTSALSDFGIPLESAPQAAQPSVGHSSKEWCPGAHIDQPQMTHRFVQWVGDYGKLSTLNREHWQSTDGGVVLRQS
eukprot:jgi/Chlat1/7052/Chrsp56S06671